MGNYSSIKYTGSTAAASSSIATAAEIDSLQADVAAIQDVTTYATIGDIPTSGNTTGDLAFVTANNILYIWSGSGWYKIATINQTPTIDSGYESSYILATDGTATTVTLVGTDPEGFDITWSATTSGDTSAATVTNVDNVFTITPSTSAANAGSLTVTFQASDGVNIGTAQSVFTLTFGDANFADTVLLLQGDGTASGDNSSFTDSSTNNHTITANGDVHQGTFSPFSKDDGDWGVFFDGSNDYIQLSANSNYLFGTSDFTIEAWINTDGSDYFSIFQNCPFGTSAATDDYFFGVSGNGALNFARHGGYHTVTSADDTVSFNEWHHVAVTRTSSVMTLWLDGTSVGTSTDTKVTSYNINQNVAHTIGWRVTPNYGGGYLSNLRITNGTALYTSSFTPSTTSLDVGTNTVFLGLQSNRFVDNSTVRNTVTPSGAKVTTFSPFARTESYSASTHGGSAYFDGSGDYLSASDSTAFNMGSGDFTVECWVYLNSTSGSQTFISTAETTDFQGFFLGLENGTVYFLAEGGLITNWDLSINSTISANTWTHIAGVRNGNVFTLYVNGVSVATDTQSLTLTNTNNKIVVGGRTAASGQYTNGYISNARVVKGTAVYTSAFTPPTAPLTAVTNTDLLLNMTDADIIDGTGFNNVKLVGNATIDGTTKKYGDGSLTFDGTGDWLQTPDSDLFNFGTGDFTIECWAKIDTPIANFRKGIVGQTENVTGRWQVRPAQNSGNFGFTYYNGSAYRDMDGGAAIPDNTWCHLAVVRDSGTFKFFIDGVKGTDNSSYTTESVGNSTGLYIMRNVWDNHDLAGFIDDLRITKGVARYTANFTVPDKLVDLGT